MSQEITLNHNNNSQSERQQTAYLVVQTTLKRHKKIKNKSTKINQQKITKNNKKTKAMENMALTVGHYPRNVKM